MYDLHIVKIEATLSFKIDYFLNEKLFKMEVKSLISS